MDHSPGTWWEVLRTSVLRNFMMLSTSNSPPNGLKSCKEKRVTQEFLDFSDCVKTCEGCKVQQSLLQTKAQPRWEPGNQDWIDMTKAKLDKDWNLEPQCGLCTFERWECQQSLNLNQCFLNISDFNQQSVYFRRVCPCWASPGLGWQHRVRGRRNSLQTPEKGQRWIIRCQ